MWFCACLWEWVSECVCVRPWPCVWAMNLHIWKYVSPWFESQSLSSWQVRFCVCMVFLASSLQHSDMAVELNCYFTSTETVGLSGTRTSDFYVLWDMAARPTALQLLGLLWMVSTCYAAVTFSMGPVMCSRHTQDVRVNCSLQDMTAQIPEKIQHLNYLQVGQNASGTPKTLVTLDLVDGDLAASHHLKSPSAHVYHLTGKYNATAKNDSWLALFIADVQVSKDDFSFYCSVIYQGSELNQKWTSEAVPFIRDKQYTDKRKGIVVEVKRGISFECKNSTAALETGITGADTKSVSSLCPKQDFGQANNCSVCLSGVERAHLYDFGCSDRDQCADTSDHLQFELPDCVSGHTTIITVSTSPPTQSPENNGWMIAFLAVVPILFLGNVCFAVWYLKCRKGGTTKARPTPRKRPPSILDPQDDDTKPETL